MMFLGKLSTIRETGPMRKVALPENQAGLPKRPNGTSKGESESGSRKGIRVRVINLPLEAGPC
jgi:hypothetical protein